MTKNNLSFVFLILLIILTGGILASLIYAYIKIKEKLKENPKMIVGKGYQL